MNKDVIKYFKVLSEENRANIVELLLKGETCGCTLIEKLPISQPTLSYHLKAITDSGLAIAKREGNWIKHYIDKDKIDEMITYLTNLKELTNISCSL